MPHRDPETGKFVSDESDHYDDIEVVKIGADVGVEAANLSGGTGFGGGDSETFEGLQILDYDEVVDRNEELVLLEASHRLVTYANSTETADGTVATGVEISASPSRSFTGPGTATDSLPGSSAVGAAAGPEDSIDPIGRGLFATATGPFSDGASGVGGGGSAGVDDWHGQHFPLEYGRFHPRDELFLNGKFTAWNIDDAGVHAQVVGQHIYGVISD